MSTNPLNDISRVYLEQVSESAVPGKPAERLGAVTAIPKSEQEAARERILAKTAAKRTKMKEALDPVGQEDADIDNDGDTDKSDKYLHKRRKAIGKAIAKKKGMKEGFSNWRQDLAEVMTDDEGNTKIDIKKNIKNKVKTSAMGGGIKLGEAVEELGGQLIEMVELDCILDEFTNTEIDLLSDVLIENVVEEVFYAYLEEGYEVAEIEDYICESIDTSLSILTEAKVTLGHDTPDTQKKEGALSRIKSAVKRVGKAVARGAGYAAGAAVRGAKAARREFKSGYERGRGGSSSGESSSSSSSSSGDSKKEGGEKKPGILSRVASKLKSGLKKAVARGARAVSRGARNVARKMEGGETKKAEAPKAAPKKAEKPADPWEGSATTPPKAKAKATPKKAAAPKAKAPAKKKKSSKLDDLLASVRNEEVEQQDTSNQKQMLSKKKQMMQKQYMLDKQRMQLQQQGKLPVGHQMEEVEAIDEKTLTDMEMKKREEIVKSMKDKASDFEKRYPGRGKEVMYATATKMAKKMVEQALGEAGDYWHPDPKKDRQISGVGNKMRAREDQAAKSKSKEDSKKLKPGESYMDYAKRHGYKSPEKKSGIMSKIKKVFK